MVTSTRLLFSKFKDQEFNQLCQLLCSVFDTTPEELVKLYQDIDSTFDKPGYPLHFANRNFFESANEAFQVTYKNSPVVAVDLPSLMELDDGQNDKPTIAIIGQDPKGDSDHEQLVVGTPYGLHHKGSREVLYKTKKYFEMIQVLLELGYRVYLTDVLKIWVCDPEKRYNGIELPDVDQQRFIQLIKPELAILQPVAVVTWGSEARDAVEPLHLGSKHQSFPHAGGRARNAWKKRIGKSATDANILAYWRKVMTQEFGK